MARNTENNLIVMQAAGTARLLIQHWDALPDEERKRMALEVCEGAIQLMAFRSAIRTMIDFERTPEDALQDYMSI